MYIKSLFLECNFKKCKCW